MEARKRNEALDIGSVAEKSKHLLKKTASFLVCVLLRLHVTVLTRSTSAKLKTHLGMIPGDFTDVQQPFEDQINIPF
jgi:hypothetical protein